MENVMVVRERDILRSYDLTSSCRRRSANL